MNTKTEAVTVAPPDKSAISELAGIHLAGLTPQEQKKLNRLAGLLWDFLQKDPEHSDRRRTGFGTKTQLGLMLSIASIMED